MANEQTTGWRPIASAPMNTEVILGWWRTWPTREWQMESGWAGKSNSYPDTIGVSDAWRHGQATHWHPMPEPPTGESA